MRSLFALSICIMLLSCNNYSNNNTVKQDIGTADPGIIQDKGESIARRFMPPQGYHRLQKMKVVRSSFCLPKVICPHRISTCS
jgi:hypothetical protein